MGKSKRRFDITFAFSIIFILICLFAVLSLREVGKEKTPSQPQIMLNETKPNSIYEPLKPLSNEESLVEKEPTNGYIGKEVRQNKDTVQKPESKPDVTEDKFETYEKVDIKLEEYIRSFFTGLGCKVQDDWIIDVPALYSVEWLKRRLSMELSELGYNLDGSTIYKDGKEILRLNFEKTKPKGKIGIIIDDVGRSTSLNKILQDIDLPLNVSILPRQSKSKEMSIIGMRKGWDILLHLPMEPKEKSWIDGTFVKITMDDKEIEKMVDSYLQELSYINGVNSHMGSLATTDERVMRIVLYIIKNRGLYFVDSLTTSDSVGEKISREIELKRFAKRDIFLDNIDDKNYIESQIKKLIEISTKKGFVIGVGHLRENTLLTIKDYNWKDKDVELVLLSEVL
ncbi:MAG: divergent polysaccharide deacetylase family protein [bacterium]|nr:divergent polysaccharide deacetylase family protein [bacterium]